MKQMACSFMNKGLSFILKQFKLRNIKMAVIRNIKMAALSKTDKVLIP